MEILIELLMELVLEGGMELSKNKKVPKFIRYPLIGLISLLFIAVFLLIIFVGVLIWKENMWVGLLMFGISLVFLVSGIREFKKIYFEKKSKDKCKRCE